MSHLSQIETTAQMQKQLLVLETIGEEQLHNQEAMMDAMERMEDRPQGITKQSMEQLLNDKLQGIQPMQQVTGQLTGLLSNLKAEHLVVSNGSAVCCHMGRMCGLVAWCHRKYSCDHV